MSRQTKKPNQQISQKVSNYKLLPNIFNTEPNKKMLDSTLDVMSSKGQLLPFRETYGIRSASNRPEEFFKVESNEVRRESQANNMLVISDTGDNYLGKSSYLDIENYLTIKGSPLKDGVVLDKDINVLELPINPIKITDYNLFYWIANDLPACRIHADTEKYSIAQSIINRPFAEIKDDISGQTLELQNGMTVYFTGAQDAEYVTIDENYPKLYYVYGVGDNINLLPATSIDKRIPDSWLKKRPWDKTSQFDDPPAIKWDSEIWDGSMIVTSEPEYITQEKTANPNHWQVIDHWYHINTIKAVAKFLNVSIEEFATVKNKAKRPIIGFVKDIKIYNWPTTTKAEIKSILPYTKGVYESPARIKLKDGYGYSLQNDDLVVFESTEGIYRVNGVGTSITFTKVFSSVNGDGALITAKTDLRYHKVIYKKNKWQLAQNKTTPNQNLLFQFYKSDGASLEDLNESSFAGGIILGFKEGETYDSILNKNIKVSNIDFDLIDETNSSAVSPNQLKFITDVDASYSYTDSATGENVVLSGPYGYQYLARIVPFYQNRKGLDFTKQTQDLQYEAMTEEPWSDLISPIASGFTTIHAYYDTKKILRFYFDVSGYGLVEFSSKKGFNSFESFMPLVSGGKFKIVCHDLPGPITFFKVSMLNNVTTPQLLLSPYCINNGTSNGIIELDLSDSILSGSSYIDNELFIENTRLMWTFATSTYKPATIKSLNKWRFLQDVYVKDQTNPVFNGYEYVISDITLPDGSLSSNQKLIASDSLTAKAKSGDKVVVNSVFTWPTARTAPISLTINPLNKKLSDINYYSLYQHATNIKSHSTNIRESVDSDSLLQTTFLGGGTLLKHNEPLSKFAIMANNMPFDLGDLLIRQGKHYDSFLNKLKVELESVINSVDETAYSSHELLTMAISKIFVTTANDNTFWAHSNMMGWGEKLDNYREVDFVVDNSLVFDLTEDFEYISHRAGKEFILHLTYDNRYLKRDVDYILINGANDYTQIQFSDNFVGRTINIKQWYGRFKAQIPASLSKIGLAPIYMPEILEDTTTRIINGDVVTPGKFFLYRHDGTRYYLEDGVNDLGGNNFYPANTIEQLLYEYELAVWSSITRDIKTNSFRPYVENIPGYFRLLDRGLLSVKQIMLNETKQWLNQNNLFLMPNNDYDANNGFTYIYKLGTGEDVYSITGSWRLIYQFLFDTDRPHTHPWEMLGHTLKPSWWDDNYSWTEPTKREALEKALRTGNINTPANKIINPKFARCNDLTIVQEFPIDDSGNLLAPDQLTWLWLTVQNAESAWLPGECSPYENVFYNTHWGLAAKSKMWYLRNPAQFVNTNWVPGQTIVNEWGNKLDRATNFWQQGVIEHDYHRQVIDSETVYTSGIESLFAEFCILNNKDYKAEVIDKFSNIKVNKEFLLNGFTNKDNVRIQSTSINSQRITLFVPEESYAVRTINHYPDKEIFYSGIRIIWDGEYYSVTGFATEDGYLPFFIPVDNSSTTAVIVGDSTFKQKNNYSTELVYQNYGERYKNRQDIFDMLIGYGKYLTSLGFVFQEPEGGDIRDWQLSAKQFAFWSNSPLAAGSYIDLNPGADKIIIKNNGGHLDNLEGTNENVGQCVDRYNKPLFSKDLLVNRFDEDNTITIKTKDASRSIYGIKLTFSYFETVIHLNSTSVFDDVYFLPEQSTTKRSFIIGGKKSQDWDGTYFAPGYVITENGVIPNYDSMAEQGRNLLDIENVVLDNNVLEASRAQFGLNRNQELRQLFLQEESEILFKNAITFNKGTVEVFNKLAPLTHKDESQSKPYEEYMVRLGEMGNTKNIEYYEFEMLSSDIRHPSKTSQVVKFIDKAEPADNDSILYFKNNSKRWVHRPFNKDLTFKTFDRTYRELPTGGPLFPGDTDLSVDTLDNLPDLYDNFAELWNIDAYDETASYKQYDQVRINGKLYYAKTTVSPNTWSQNNDKFSQIDEPILPNIYVGNYYRPNPDLAEDGMSIFKPGTWQVLQTVDRDLSILEICPGPDDFSQARATTNKAHKLSVGDYVLIVNANLGNTSINGIWKVQALGEGDAKETQFFINATLGDNCYTGKVFTFKPVRFKNYIDFVLATGALADVYGYTWKKKYNPFTNAIGQTTLTKTDTPSGYSPTWPIAIIDDGLNADNKEATFDYGNYKVYDSRNWHTPLKEESKPVDPSDIEHLIIYDYADNKTVIKLELFDPKKMYIPEVFKNDIDVINRVDPAKYNRSTDTYKAVYASMGWHEEYIGKRWWDTSTVQFSDYESKDELTKEKYWGTTINGKLPDVYEWTKSPVPPSQWNKLVEKGGNAFDQIASGEVYVDRAMNIDNYHWVEEEDYVNGEVFTVYYFWVKNKNVIAEQSIHSRVYTTEQLSKVLLNPSAAGIPWWAPISNNAIMLKGVQPYLNNTSTVVQIKKKSKGNEKHQQWIFISEDNTVETIPEWLHVRLRDSLSAHIFYRKRAVYNQFDSTQTYTQDDLVKYNGYFYVCRYTTTGRFQPDAWQALPIQYYSLTKTYNKLDVVLYNDNIYVCKGTTTGAWNSAKWQVLPAGSLSVRDIDPRHNTLDFNITKNVPDIFNLHPYGRLGNLVRPYIQSWFNDALEARRTFIKKLNEIMVNVNISNIDAWGDTRLNNEYYVVGDEIIDVTAFWTYTDYISETYDATKEISIVLESTSDIYTTSVTTGSYIKVNTGIRDYSIFEKNVDGSFSTVYKTKGAIKFTSDLYAPWSLSSYDTVGWDKLPWDYDLNSVYNAILDSLRYEIFTGQYSKYYSKIMCTMFRYVMSEQVGVDWLAKSSTVEPVNLISSTLEADDSLQRDQITVLTSFYNSVKSYRDKIRGGTVNRTVTETVQLEVSEELMIYEDGQLILNA